MLKSEKTTLVLELEKIYRSSNSIIITHYRGLSVLEMTNLRKSLRKNAVSFKVIKNTLSKLAAAKFRLADEPKFFLGPTAIAYSKNLINAAKGVVEFSKNNDKLKIVGGIIENRILDVDEIQELANLPPIDQIRGKIVTILQNTVAQLMRTVQAPAISLTSVIKLYSEKNFIS